VYGCEALSLILREECTLRVYENACCHSVQNILSSGLLSKNLKIKTYTNIILPVVLYGCENWSLILREERTLRVYENACCHSVQNILSSGLLSKNLKIKTLRIIILPVVLYGCETWSLILRKECTLRVYENRVLRRIFRSKRDEVTGEWNNYIMRSLMICTAHQILFGR